MNVDQQSPLEEPPTASGGYATPGEARKAIESLSAGDLVKLMTIARFFWRQRMHGTGAAWEGPEDLLQEAVVRTLEGSRRWSRSVSIIRHLDRTMESLAGHALEKEVARSRGGASESVDDGAEPADRSRGSTTEAGIAAREELAGLEAVFQDDDEAWNLLLCQAEGRTASETRVKLGMSDIEYATVRRRIRRAFLRICKTTKDQP